MGLTEKLNADLKTKTREWQSANAWNRNRIEGAIDEIKVIMQYIGIKGAYEEGKGNAQ